jgi:hypothetical protein
LALTPEQISQLLHNLETIIGTDAARPLRDLCLAEDDRLGLPLGSHLSLVRHAIATRRWKMNMSVRIDPVQPIQAIGTSTIQ